MHYLEEFPNIFTNELNTYWIIQSARTSTGLKHHVTETHHDAKIS